MNCSSSKKSGFSSYLIVASLFVLGLSVLNGCESQKSQTPQTANEPVKKFERQVKFKGVVSYSKGSPIEGLLKVSNTKGQSVATLPLAGDKHYEVSIPADTILPLLISFHPKHESLETPLLTNVAIHPNLTQYDLNEFTTAIVDKAKALGGFTHGNMIVAAESMGSVPAENKTSAGWRGDLTKQYGGWH